MLLAYCNRSEEASTFIKVNDSTAVRPCTRAQLCTRQRTVVIHTAILRAGVRTAVAAGYVVATAA